LYSFPHRTLTIFDLMWRTLILGAMLYLVLTGSTLHAQSGAGKKAPEPKKNIAKINLLSPFLGSLSVQLETLLDEESSFQLGFYYFSGLVFGQESYMNGICITPEYRLYMSTNAPAGVYVQPFVRLGKFWNTQTRVSRPDVDFTAVAAGIVVGKQWIFRDKITFDVYGGPYYSKLFFDSDKADKKFWMPIGNAYWIRSGLTIGFLF
jgi:hypothetical protein